MLVIPCIAGERRSERRRPGLAVGIDPSRRLELHARRSRPRIGHLLDDIAPPARARGRGLLGIPYDDVMQAALIPVAHTIGEEFRPGPRKPLDTIVHWDQW